MNWFKALLEADNTPLNWVIRHSLYWIVFTLILSTSWIYWFGTFDDAAWAVVSNMTIRMPIVYLFLYFVLPSLLHKQHQRFAFRLAVWFVLSLLYRYLYGQWITPLQSQTDFTDNAFRKLFDVGFMLFNNDVFVAASLKMFRYWYRKTRANQQLAQETLLVELQLLKAQVHPHFLFNTLNNIYSLALRGSDKAPEVVDRLLGLLRYMFRECNAPTVPLTKEIELIRNYTQLEQIRYGNRLNIELIVEGDLATRPIAPLLLIPFVENAFKHGASEQTDKAYIRLTLLVAENELMFRLENSKDAGLTRPAHVHGGLGLANVRKRLALIYPHRHTLTIGSEPTRYVVELTIQLANDPAQNPHRRLKPSRVPEATP
ncbi:MAG TPA: histidine kinase [Spirosoma sp.]|nr:histidine kinase [Spirosoma sp.]